jgi:glycosyltransferase involved in cell wall biosynthesis
MPDTSQVRALYICYFGLLEPLVQSQVLPYIREIKKLDGAEMTLVTFEPELKIRWTPEQIEMERVKLAAEGIDWHCRAYHKSPSVPATFFDVFSGAFYVSKLIRRKDVNIVHCRSHVATMMGVLARALSRRPRVKVLFDIRGFFPEEYTDAGNWKKNGRLFKAVKKAEKMLLRKADGFVVLTEKARAILFPGSEISGKDKNGRPVEVIPCCVDLSKFASANADSRERIRREYNLSDRRVIIYAGSLGTWYLANEMADLFAAAREKDPKAFALVLTQSDPEIMAEKLRARGFAAEDMLIKRVPSSEVPQYLSAADIALSFIMPCFSKQSSSPTKIAEYLASGVPIVTNRGVGDVDGQIEADATGAIVEDFSAASYAKAIERIETLENSGTLSDVCRRSARERFDLGNIGGTRYRRLYQNLLAGKK